MYLKFVITQKIKYSKVNMKFCSLFCSGVLLSGSGVLLSGIKNEKIVGVLLSGSGVLLSLTGVLLSGNGVLLSDIFKNIYCWSSYVFGVLLSLGFYCRVNIHFLKIFKKLGFYCRWSSSVFGVLLSLEFHCQHPIIATV